MALIHNRGSLRLVASSEAAECGLACLAMVLGYHGRDTDLATLRRRFAVSLKGTTMRTLVEMGQRLGLAARGFRMEPEELRGLKLPAILHWDMTHWVVLTAIDGRSATIYDPAKGARRMSLKDLSQHFTGMVLELTPAEGFERKKERSKLALTSLWGRVDGMCKGLAQALVLSVVLQAFVMVSPFYMQLAIDEGVMKGDGGLLVALAVGYGMFTVIRLIADWLRSRVLLALGELINYQMVVNLFHHMIRLPLDWFEKRHIGDIVSRFGSSQPIRNFVTNGFIAILVDGAMAVLTLVVIFVYSPTLAFIVVVCLAIHVAIRLIFFRLLRQREEEVIQAGAKEQSSFIETARAMQTIKVFGQESDREAVWQHRYAETINRDVHLGRLNINFAMAQSLLDGVQMVLIVYIGARLAMDNHLTVGMLVAFVAYKQQFNEKAAALLDLVIQYRMQDLHLDRISDIALAEREKGLGGESDPLIRHTLAGSIVLRGVSYRYAETEADVISGVDLDVSPGEFIAITGPSGGGKTTLFKVMVGLFRPTAGEILVDGVPMDHVGPIAYRSQIGVVMQDDHLLSGSLAENITFFDPAPDMGWMRECATAAGIDADIMAMPMNYNTPVGDMGSSLSSGQRQRIFLARALYKRPRILFVDEGTSHLDIAKEREVNEHMARLAITRIIIAHRKETIAAADRVLLLDGGRLSEWAAKRPPAAANE